MEEKKNTAEACNVSFVVGTEHQERETWHTTNGKDTKKSQIWTLSIPWLYEIQNLNISYPLRFHSLILVTRPQNLAAFSLLFTNQLFHPWPQGFEQFCKRKHCEWFKIFAGQHFKSSVRYPQPKAKQGKKGPRRSSLRNPSEPRIHSLEQQLAQKWVLKWRPFYLSSQFLTSGYRKAGCGWEMLEKMQDVLFLWNILATSRTLHSESQARLVNWRIKFAVSLFIASYEV